MTQTGMATNPAIRIYTGILNQYGTDAPECEILHNTLGTIVFARVSTGNYTMTSGSKFKNNKTWWGSITTGVSTQSIHFQRISDNVIAIYTAEGGVPADEILLNSCIEIRVYK